MYPYPTPGKNIHIPARHCSPSPETLTLTLAMEYPSSPSSSSSSSVHSSLTEYPQSAEYSSDETYSTESSVNSSPKNPQHPSITSPSSTNYYSFSPPPTPRPLPLPLPLPPPPMADGRRSSPPRFEGLRREPARTLDFATFMRARCVRYYLAWNACMDEALRTGRDYQLMCASVSRLFRDCVRHF